MTTPRRMENGPNILCRMCGEVSNHVSGLCSAHRREADDFSVTAIGLSKADRAYLEWKRQRDASNG
jgi:hypothetical protein